MSCSSNNTATANLIQGNFIGLNAGGTAAVPNQGVQSGINITNGASANSVIGNVVSGNTQHAVTVFGSTTNANVIQGNIIGTDPTGLIRLANGGIGVDVVSATNTVVGGVGAARNIIAGNGTGIQIRTGAAGTLVQNNYIGVAASGTAAISNGLGITINDGAGANIIGGTTPGLGNLISGNTGTGISLANTPTTDNSIVGNFIGTGPNGVGQLANSGDGINVNGATDTLIGGPAAGAGNTIAFNGGNGVNVSAGTGTRISTNVITGNGLLGINLSLRRRHAKRCWGRRFGANNIQNFPVLTSAVDNGTTLTVQGTLNSLANTPFRIEIFGNAAGDASGFGEGATPLGFVNVTTDGTGNATFSTVVPDPGGITVVTATAEVRRQYVRVLGRANGDGCAAIVCRHQHERHRCWVTASGNHRFQRHARRDRHDQLQYSRRRRAHDHTHNRAAGDSLSGDHRCDDATRLRRCASHRVERSGHRGGRHERTDRDWW